MRSFIISFYFCGGFTFLIALSLIATSFSVLRDWAIALCFLAALMAFVYTIGFIIWAVARCIQAMRDTEEQL